MQYNYTALTELLNSLDKPLDIVHMLEDIERNYLEIQNKVPMELPHLTAILDLLGKLIDALSNITP